MLCKVRPMSDPRAVRYRRLALAESNVETSRLLQRLADEAERGVLVISDLRRHAAAPPPVPAAIVTKS